ncbi:DUF378 domain-containing protein [Halovivax gelatinilyticus]|uniref:DUF378 domain-containing protein n=1 Tax=Halovivax gelatinilyticus TaxID=2961597 RepID=UPI0020CA6875|nr:DUF378 domain-containing protein [Halovivax gelatinilyticus]
MRTQTRPNLSPIEWFIMALVTVGAINWGLVGLEGFVGGNLNLVNLLFGSVSTIEYSVYLLVGLAGLSILVTGIRRYRSPAEDAAEIEHTEPAR